MELEGAPKDLLAVCLVRDATLRACNREKEWCSALGVRGTSIMRSNVSRELSVHLRSFVPRHPLLAQCSSALAHWAQ